MELPSTAELATVAPSRPSTAAGFGALRSEDFLSLMIAELQNQDPLQPASNEELMQQIATIRDMELSVTLTDSIRQLADQQTAVNGAITALVSQQRFGSASTLIGKYVHGQANHPLLGSVSLEGLVRSVRFT